MPRILFSEASEITGRVKRHFFLALMAVFALQACVTPLATEKVEATEQIFATVEPFYSWVLAHGSVSFPSEKERSELADFLVPELIQLMKDAEEMQSRCVKAAAEGDKPMIFEGALLVGNYEGATEVAYEEPRMSKQVQDTVILPAILTYINEYFQKANRFRAVSWNDELELQRKERKWFIGNIKFPHETNLRSILQNYINTAHRECIVP